MARRFLYGLLLIGIGLLFLAGQLGYIDVNPSEIVPTYWPLILIFIGLSGLVGQVKTHNAGSVMWSLFMVALGGGFLLRNLGYLDMGMDGFIKLLIPVFVILFGIRMMFKPAKKPTSGQTNDYSYKYEYKYENGKGASADYSVPPPPPEDPLSVKDEPASASPPPSPRHTASESYKDSQFSWQAGENRSGFIGDLYLGHDYWELKPMNVSHFIGDTIIDLTKAQIPLGETKLNVSAFIGDVKVLVPNDIDVEFLVNSSSFLGDITVFSRKEGGFLRSMREETSGYSHADKKIRLDCSLFIGDIQVQRVG